MANASKKTATPTFKLDQAGQVDIPAPTAGATIVTFYLLNPATGGLIRCVSKRPTAKVLDLWFASLFDEQEEQDDARAALPLHAQADAEANRILADLPADADLDAIAAAKARAAEARERAASSDRAAYAREQRELMVSGLDRAHRYRVERLKFITNMDASDFDIDTFAAFHGAHDNDFWQGQDVKEVNKVIDCFRGVVAA